MYYSVYHRAGAGRGPALLLRARGGRRGTLIWGCGYNYNYIYIYIYIERERDIHVLYVYKCVYIHIYIYICVYYHYVNINYNFRRNRAAFANKMINQYIVRGVTFNVCLNIKLLKQKHRHTVGEIVLKSPYTPRGPRTPRPKYFNTLNNTR